MSAFSMLSFNRASDQADHPLLTQKALELTYKLEVYIPLLFKVKALERVMAALLLFELEKILLDKVQPPIFT
jgi:hypothetical protein